MSLQEILLENTIKGISSLYGITMENVEIQQTRKEFEGDYTLVLFPLLKHIKANPQEIGEKLGDYLSSHSLWEGQPIVSGYNVVKGFLNLSICENYFLHFLHQIAPEKDYGKKPITKDSPAVIVEYSSPNTNKPLHLGHIRNNLLGFSMAKIIEATGKKVYKTQIINDRGIHICKSMIAWQLFGKGETPESTGEKGDKLVGKYYVLFYEGEAVHRIRICNKEPYYRVLDIKGEPYSIGSVSEYSEDEDGSPVIKLSVSFLEEVAKREIRFYFKENGKMIMKLDELPGREIMREGVEVAVGQALEANFIVKRTLGNVAEPFIKGAVMAKIRPVIECERMKQDFHKTCKHGS